MSKRIADVIPLDVSQLHPNKIHFVRAKRIVHEALMDHYIVPVEADEAQSLIKNTETVILRYLALPYSTEVTVVMGVDKDTFLFNFTVSFMLCQLL